MQTRKIRHQFYLSDELSEKLERLAAQPGASKTSIMSDALAAWIERAGQNELDHRFGHRLDRIGNASAGQTQDIRLLIEMLGTFVQHQLTLTAHHPAFERDAIQVGKRRYDAFMDLVSRRLGGPVSAPPASLGDRLEASDEAPAAELVSRPRDDLD